MMHILSKPSVNDENLSRDSQVALHPFDRNVIIIGSYSFVVLIVKDPVNSGWSAVGPEVLNCSQVRATLATSSSAKQEFKCFAPETETATRHSFS